MSNVLITGARAPVALHLARLFSTAGHRVWLADSHRFPVSGATRFVERYVRLPSPRRAIAAYGEAVEALVQRLQIDAVIPTCEEVFFLAASRDLHGRALPLLAPSFDTLVDAHQKATFAKEASGLGADPPRTDLITSVSELALLKDVGMRVLKPAWSRFASRVLIQPDADQLAALRPTPADPWLVQDYVSGDEMCSYGVARDGKLVAFAAYRPLHRAGLGAGIAFEALNSGPDHAVIKSFAAGYAARTHWTGQLSFDFRRDADGALHALECNPRATSGLHFFTPADDLPGALLGAMLATPQQAGPMTAPLAMLVYGLPQAIRTRTVSAWWRDFRHSSSIFSFPGDRNFLGPQFLAVMEIAVVAVASGKSLQQAATDDIEWNGEPLD